MEILRKAWHVWKRVGQALGDLIGRAALTVFYFTLFLPFGVGVRLLADPLAINSGLRARWLERPTHAPSIGDAQRLY